HVQCQYFQFKLIYLEIPQGSPRGPPSVPQGSPKGSLRGSPKGTLGVSPWGIPWLIFPTPSFICLPLYLKLL
ncbi:hypothetical protein L9F63_028353, partial [Diploptera punctata]